MAEEQQKKVSVPNKEAILLKLIWDHCEEQYLNTKFFDWLLKEIRKINWDIQIIRNYSPQIIECVNLVEDFNNNKYNRISKDDVILIVSLLFYFTKPTFLVENIEDLYETEKTMITVTALMGHIGRPLEDYREFKYNSGEFLRQKIKAETRTQKAPVPYGESVRNSEEEKEKKVENTEDDGPTDDWGLSAVEKGKDVSKSNF